MLASDVIQQTSPGVFATLDKNSLFILKNGWAASTVRHYAAAVNRYFKFLEETRSTAFPASSENIYDFVVWCRENASAGNVLTSTTKRYLTGLRMWHVLHNAEFPPINTHRLRLLFKAAKVTEVTPHRVRTGLTLMDLNELVSKVDSSTLSGLIQIGVLLTGFWGLARLGELTLNQDHPDIFIRLKDVSFNESRTHAKLMIRMAKTAAPGEKQFLRLSKQPNTLDPCIAIQRILDHVPGLPTDPLFPDLKANTPVRRDMIIAIINSLKPTKHSSCSGHSLRIGGASLRAHYGCSVKSLKRSGRWTSSCYKLYIRPYDTSTATKTAVLAKKLRHTNVPSV